MKPSSNFAREDTPRYKIKERGVRALTDVELIVQLLGAGESLKTYDMAQQLCNKAGNGVQELCNLRICDIMQFAIKGVTERMASNIVAAGEIHRRLLDESSRERNQIRSSREAFDVLYPYLMNSEVEYFYACYLNRANKVLRVEQVSQGGLTGTVADPRVIFMGALRAKSTGIILCHNHPSGNLAPSQADIDLTKKMRESGKLLEIQILDHIIIDGNRYYSFAEEGRL